MSVFHRLRIAYAALVGQRLKALADLHPELVQREHIYSSSAQFAAAEADDYVGAAGLYRSYVWVRKAIMLYAQSIAPLPVRVIGRSGEPVPGHPLAALYATPNRSTPPARFWATEVTHMLLAGERFVEIVDDSRGRPVELWPRRPDYVQVVPDESQLGYARVAGYHLDELADGYQEVGPDAVIHERFVNPLSDWRGIGPIRAVLAGVRLDLFAQAQAQSFYQNQARPDYAITTDQILAPDERMRLEMQIDAKYGVGGTRTHKPIILEAGQGIQVLSFAQKDIAGLEQRAISRDEVAAIFAIPDILMGFGADSYDTEEKREAAMATFWTLGLLPMIQQRDDAETHFWSSVRPLLRDGERVATDLSGVAVIQEKIGPKIDNAIKLFGMGIPLNRIDQLLRLGVGPVAGGDVGYLPAALLPVDALGAALPPPQQAAQPVQQKAARPNPRRMALALQRIRWAVAARLKTAIDQFFVELAERVTARARAAGKACSGDDVAQKANLPTPDQLLLPTDSRMLAMLLRAFVLDVVRASWETWNDALTIDLAFDEHDPAVVLALAQAGDRVDSITETTRQALARLLQQGVEEGLSIDDIAPLIRITVTESYAGRARAIARTELGYAQQTAALARYESAGLGQVLVLDNGRDDPDEACQQLNGTIQTLAWARQNALGHPNCTRAFAPYIED